MNTNTNEAPAISADLNQLSASDEDPARLWAEIHRLRAEVIGPQGYATWKDAAVTERAKAAALSEWINAALVPLQAISDLEDFEDGGEGMRSLIAAGRYLLD